MSKILYCPACPVGPELRVMDPHLRRPLRRCDSCLGVLVSLAAVATAATYYHGSHYVMREGHGRHSCRSCEAVFERWRERCRVCLQAQTIGCMRCQMPMDVVEVSGVALDVCRQCRWVWFDRGELGLLTRRHAAELQSRLLQGGGSRGVAGGLHGANGADVLAVSGEAVAGVVNLAAAAGEGAVDLAGAAIEVLLSVFDGS